jgi:NADP-dependent 3-hydroxy acid dehydrogenase YdfG
MSSLKDKNIIVTGASGGIGNSIVEKLNQNGINILATGTRIEKLEELKEKFDNIKILKFDISQHDIIEEFIENATKELGGSLDCIVNNAGITKDNLTIRMSLEEWTKVIDVNLTSTFLMCKYSIKKMLKKGHENENHGNQAGETKATAGSVTTPPPKRIFWSNRSSRSKPQPLPRTGQVRSGQVRSGQVRSGQVRSGQVRSDQVMMVSI